MKVNTVGCFFLKSAPKPQDFPSALYPEMAFWGRSNVGKSSLMNALMGQKSKAGGARVSKRPGCTQMINFYMYPPGLRMVDLPGYGFAQVPGRVQDAWGQLIAEYILHRACLWRLYLLIDARHPAQPADKKVMTWLKKNGKSFIILLTKADAVSKNLAQARVNALEQAYPGVSIQVVSSKNKEGLEEILADMDTLSPQPLPGTQKIQMLSESFSRKVEKSVRFMPGQTLLSVEEGQDKKSKKLPTSSKNSDAPSSGQPLSNPLSFAGASQLFKKREQNTTRRRDRGNVRKESHRSQDPFLGVDRMSPTGLSPRGRRVAAVPSSLKNREIQKKGASSPVKLLEPKKAPQGAFYSKSVKSKMALGSHLEEKVKEEKFPRQKVRPGKNAPLLGEGFSRKTKKKPQVSAPLNRQKDLQEKRRKPTPLRKNQRDESVSSRSSSLSPLSVKGIGKSRSTMSSQTKNRR